MAMISLQEAYDRARRWIESNDPERAIGLAQYILERYPNNLEAYRILGEAYLADRQLDQAQEAFERVLRSDPENVPAHVGLGITHERQGRLDRAIPAFEKAWEIKPEMAELRGQLLRLYADAWGSEHAQLRLRGGGLARLYAKGHMLPQAIAEFRKVIDDQPDRYDAKVALAEALWRDGQEDESASLIHKLLQERSELLKPNLLLGYMELASGNASGQKYWDAAYDMDPYQTVAQAMFDTLPDDTREEPSIEEWDEAAWRQQREQEQQELAATRPIPVPSSSETDDISDSGLDRQPTTLPPPPPPRATATPADNDDFLAGLLGMGAFGAADTASPSEETEQTDTEGEQFTSMEDDAVLSPFSLSELGLSDDDFSDFDTESPAAEPSAVAQDEDVDTAAEPFSIDDLGLDNDLADLHAGEENTSTAPAPEDSSTEARSPEGEDIRSAVESGAIEPFSLADLGLSDDEVANIGAVEQSDGISTEAEPSEAEPSESETASAAETEISAPLESSQSIEEEDLSEGLASGRIQPFSFSELGLSDEELSTLGFGTSEDQEQADTESFSEEFMRGEASPDASLMEDAQTNNVPEQNVAEAQQPETESIAEALESGTIEPFSFADLGLSDDEIASLSLGDAASGEAAQDEAPREQQLEAESISGGLESGLIEPFSLADLGLSDEEIASLNEIGESPTSDVSNDVSATANDTVEADVQPFSLSDLGLSDEEFDNLNELGTTEPGTSSNASTFADISDDDFDLPDDLQPFSLDELDISSPESSDLDVRGGSGLPTSLQPFSLDEPTERPSAPTQPAREDNFAHMPNEDDDSGQQSGGYSWQEPLQRSQPRFISSMNKEESGEGMSIFAKLKQRKQEEPGVPEQEEPASGSANDLDDRMLFSMDDISLRDADVAGSESVTEASPVDANASTTTSPSTEQDSDDATSISDAVAAGEIQPFSLSDLGLSEEEIAALGFGNAAAPSATTESPQSSEELTGSEQFSEEQPESAREVQPFSFTDQNVLDETVSSQQKEDAEPESISEGLNSGEIQPFSFADLGLTDDEIASLNLNSPTDTHAAPESSDTNDESAFSFDFDNLDANASQTSNVEQPTTSDNEDVSDIDLQPFSLNDLGLSDDEIDSLGFNFSDEGESRQSSFDLTEDDLAGLDFGSDAWTQPATQEQTQQPDTTSETQDDVVTRLVALGQQQGYVDVSDIIAAIGTDEADESRVEEVVQQLQDANIQLRDGDEVIDLNAEDVGSDLDLVSSSQDTADAEPDLTPFSLAELGLSDEEIASLGLASEELAQPQSTADAEPDLTPFSLNDLGLSDEEAIADDNSEVAPPSAHVPDEPQQAQAATEPVSSVELTQASTDVRTPHVSSETASQLSPALAEYVRQLDSDPQNHILRLSVARAVGQSGMSDMSVQQYRYLIRQNALLDVVIDDIRDLIDEVDDPRFLQRLHRLLGDAFSKQGRLNEAMEEYKWVAQ